MESRETKVEQIHAAIKQLMEEERMKKSSSSSSDESSSFLAVDCEEEDRHHILAKLLSQLETFRGDGELEQPDPSAGQGRSKMDSMSETTGVEVEDSAAATSDDGEEIVKELRELKRQNFITHCLVSAMIFLTVVWQISEVSLILKVKDGVSHPFRYLGRMMAGMVKTDLVSSSSSSGHEGGKQSSGKQKHFTASRIPALHVPEIPHMELTAFDSISDKG